MNELNMTLQTTGAVIQEDPKLGGVKFIDLIIPFREAVKLEPGNSNVRLPSATAPTVKAMLKTATDAPKTFHLINRGLVYHCQNASTTKSTLTLSIPRHLSRKDCSKYGLLDGGHTLTAIKEVMADLDSYLGKSQWVEPDVRVRVYVNISDDLLPKVAAGLNTSRQVKEHSLADYRGEFGWYKEMLAKAGVPLDNVGFREGEKRPWQVLTVNKRAAVMLKERWKSKDPMQVYKSSKWSLTLFLDNKEEFRLLTPVFFDVVTLPNRIISYFSAQGFLVFPKKLPWVKVFSKVQRIPNTDFETKQKVDEGLLLPVAAAFRDCLRLEDGGYVWEVPVKEVLAIAGPALAEIMVSAMKRTKYRVQAVVSDPAYWAQLRSTVLQAKLAYLSEHPRVIRKENAKTAGPTYSL